MDTSEQVAARTEQLHTELQNYRMIYGTPYRIALGDRPVFGHHALLELREDEERDAKIFGLDPEKVTYENMRHHPYFQLIALKRPLCLEDIKLLPGEEYEVLQCGDDEIVRIIFTHISPKIYTLSRDNIISWMNAQKIDPLSETGQKMLALATPLAVDNK